jgi:Ser/Thr protein kinase RdoA (MazF antagonist)
MISQEVLTEYNLGEIHTVEPKSGGGIDESFVVISDSGHYFFKRRSPEYTPEMVGCDHALVQFLISHAFPTPPVVPTRRGDTWVEWEGRVHEAYVYVEGTGYALGYPRQMASLGQIVAQYHQLVSRYHPARMKLPAWKHMSVARFLDIDGYATPRVKALLSRGWIGEQEAQFVRRVARQLRTYSDQVEEAALASLTVHGALEPGNVLFGKGGEKGDIVALVDWADSAQFARAFDVAHALLKFAARRPDATLPGQVGPLLPWPSVQSFATAYRQTIHLTKEERTLLPWLMLTIRVVDALWIQEANPQNHRRELHLAQRLGDWLLQNATALDEVFR